VVTTVERHGLGEAAAKHRVSPTELVLNVTLRCPLNCGLCCFSSYLRQAVNLSADDVKRAIAQAARVGSIEIVHLVGGDPFLHPEVMIDAIACAATHGLRCGTTTSAFWAKTPERALDVLRPMRAAGLTEITLSYDDAHAEFVRPAFIANAVEAAQQLDLVTRVAVVVEPGCRITAASLRAELGLVGNDRVKVYETAINSTGRAAEADSQTQRERASQPGVYRGPCRSMLKNFTVDHEGRIRPCCGVLPHHDGLSVGTVGGAGIEAGVRAAYAEALYKWVAFEGPVAILKDVTADDATPLRDEDFDGICTACDRIFGDPAMLARVRKRTSEQRERIALLEQVYTKLGLFEPPPSAAQVDHDG
jgi:hypothetical protein